MWKDGLGWMDEWTGGSVRLFIIIIIIIIIIVVIIEKAYGFFACLL
jgi:hypothetical protein